MAALQNLYGGQNYWISAYIKLWQCLGEDIALIQLSVLFQICLEDNLSFAHVLKTFFQDSALFFVFSFSLS